MTDENWIDWPNGAQLKDLPVGSRVRYREAHYARTENGLRVYWAGRAKKIVGTEYLLSKQAFIEPIKVSLPTGYRFEGSEVVKDEPKPEPTYATFAQACASRQNQAEQQRGSGIESPLARAVREQIAQAEAYTAQVCQRQGQLQYGTCPECSQQCWIQLSQVCAACGATAKSIEAKRARPACKCGATENVRHVAWGQHRCGSCEQSRRRAELQAQKLEQTKRDMSRPVKRDPYEWLGFSSADWEE